MSENRIREMGHDMGNSINNVDNLIRKFKDVGRSFFLNVKGYFLFILRELFGS